MSSHESVTTLRIEPGHSRLIAGVVVLGHVGALTLLITLPFIWWLPLVVLAVGVSLWRMWPIYVARRRTPAYAVTWEGDGRWKWCDAGREPVPCRLVPPTFVHPRLVALNLLCDGRRRSVLLVSDNVDPDLLRRLRVRLRREAGRDRLADLIS
jgi:toxin CptA